MIGSAGWSALFDHPILNSPHKRPSRDWELNEQGQPTREHVETAKAVITNRHALKLRERLGLSTGNRAPLRGRLGDELSALETEYQVPRRVMPERRGMTNILAINDEAKDCGRENPAEEDDQDFEGLERENADGTSSLQNGALPLLRNFGGSIGDPLRRAARDRRCFDASFRRIAADEVHRFRREIVERIGDARAGAEIGDQDLLREVMNTVGQRGASMRCLVSVSTLTEGWDANTVTQVLGVHAFGAQLLCDSSLSGRVGPAARTTPPALRPGGEASLRRGVRRRLRHPLRLHGEIGRRSPAAAARDRDRQGHRPRARCAGDPLPTMDREIPQIRPPSTSVRLPDTGSPSWTRWRLSAAPLPAPTARSELTHPACTERLHLEMTSRGNTAR